MRLMLRSATYWISHSAPSSVTSGGASFLTSARVVSGELVMERIWLMITFTAESTTAQLACCRRGVTRSTTLLASASSCATYEASESRMNTWPHSVHSLSAASSLYTLFALSWKMRLGSPADASLISVSAATALATTIGLASASSSRSWSTNPRSSTSSGLMSCSFATQIAAVFRTYGSSSVSVRCSGSHRYSVIFSTRMHPIVRTARARIKGFGSAESFTNVFTARMVSSGWLLA
mmetsp:Transcript_12710/g.53248  ORF Transcript_12710/g.53248 Transcript_12710/m.53248 type:complete len:236 (-) Transcript_12710:278-985(-)